MSETSTNGVIAWADLTVDHAVEVKEFYTQVLGWKAVPVPMGVYDDYVMQSPDGELGICHARGANAKIPPQWLIYIRVRNVHQAVELCKTHGGSVIDGPRPMGGKEFCVIRDPAGAVLALIET